MYYFLVRALTPFSSMSLLYDAILASSPNRHRYVKRQAPTEQNTAYEHPQVVDNTVCYRAAGAIVKIYRAETIVIYLIS